MAAQLNGIKSSVDKLSDLVINPLLYLMFGAAFIYFLWGLFIFVKNRDDGEGRQKGIQHMIYGVLGFVLMISAKAIYDIINASVNSFK